MMITHFCLFIGVFFSKKSRFIFFKSKVFFSIKKKKKHKINKDFYLRHIFPEKKSTNAVDQSVVCRIM